jgi:nicotinate-nucleotide--dimethylbenzimidazole phosphoribosyltransferase
LRWETRVGLAAVLSFVVVVSAAVAKRGWLSGKGGSETVAAKDKDEGNAKARARGKQAGPALASKRGPARSTPKGPAQPSKRGAPPVGSIPPPPAVAEVTVEPSLLADRVASPPASLVEGGPPLTPEVRQVANHEVSPPPLGAEELPGLPEEPTPTPPTEVATSEPIATEPVPTEPVATEPAPTEPVADQLTSAASQPVAPEPVASEPVASELVLSEPDRTHPSDVAPPVASQPIGMLADVPAPPTTQDVNPRPEPPAAEPIASEVPQIAQAEEPAAPMPEPQEPPTPAVQGEPLPHFSTPPSVAQGEPVVEPGAAGTPIPNVGVHRPAEKGITLTRGVAPSERTTVEPGARIEPQPHVVQAGENFYTISQTYYRSGRFYKALWKANQARVPDIRKLYIGTTILVPPPEALDPALVDPAPTVITSTPKPRTPASSNPSAEPPLTDPDDRVEVRPRRVGPLYTTSDRHETLRSVARRTLGDVYRWPEIRKLNLDVLDDSSAYLPVGTELRLPEDARTARR